MITIIILITIIIKNTVKYTFSRRYAAIRLLGKSDRIEEKQVTTRKRTFYFGEFHAKRANTYKSRSKQPKLINLDILSATFISRARRQRTRTGG